MNATDLIDTLPAAWYRDPEHFARERRHIFARHWHLIGRAGQLQRAGDYVTGNVAGWPVFAVMDREGGLRAFHNVCRHRAGPLFTDESGRCQALRCQYHGWLYGFDGSLRTAPGFPDSRALDKSRFGLFPVRVDTWQGLLFVCLDPEAPPLDAWMGDVNEVTAPYPAITDFTFHSVTAHDGACDWKAYGDNSCEGYHLPFVHEGLNKAVACADIRPYRNGGFVGFHVGYSGDVRDGAGLWIYKFPAILLHYSDRAINIEQVEALGPGRIRIQSYYWVPEGEERFGDDYVQDSRIVIGEDMAVSELVQKNLEAGLYTSGKLSDEKEPGTIFFQHLVREAMDLPPVEPGTSA
ncbi:MAG: aromatic ring-hydroxylating dioxygenase subunit alpha [Rhodospirillales bacterium]|nr:aromatic ring-hydroxylating dioxygenase subunit alpha [Rhodospirillales bacterium]